MEFLNIPHKERSSSFPLLLSLRTIISFPYILFFFASISSHFLLIFFFSLPPFLFLPSCFFLFFLLIPFPSLPIPFFASFPYLFCNSCFAWGLIVNVPYHWYKICIWMVSICYVSKFVVRRVVTIQLNAKSSPVRIFGWNIFVFIGY